jgi:hypothetical protein
MAFPWLHSPTISAAQARERISIINPQKSTWEGHNSVHWRQLRQDQKSRSLKTAVWFPSTAFSTNSRGLVYTRFSHRVMGQTALHLPQVKHNMTWFCLTISSMIFIVFFFPGILFWTGWFILIEQ